MRVGEIKVGEGDRAGGTIRRGAPGGVGKIGRASWRVGGAGDGEGDGLGGRAAMAVSDSDDVALGEVLASGEEIEGATGDRQLPAYSGGLTAGAFPGDGIE